MRNIAGKSIKEKINKLNRDKFSIKEIAMIIGENDCVANYDKCPNCVMNMLIVMNVGKIIVINV